MPNPNPKEEMDAAMLDIQRSLGRIEGKLEEVTANHKAAIEGVSGRINDMEKSADRDRRWSHLTRAVVAAIAAITGGHIGLGLGK